MKGAVIFLVFLIFLLLCAWIMKIIKNIQLGKMTRSQKIVNFVGTAMILGLLIMTAIPLFKK